MMSGQAKKAVILNGSPRNHGSTATVLRTIGEEIGHHAEVEWFDAYRLQLRPCVGCMKCRPAGECAMPEDDAHRVRAAIAAAQVFVVRTPTYWGNMSAPLKALFDRNVTLFETFERGWPAPRQKGKNAIIVVSSASPWPLNLLSAHAGGAIDSIRKILRSGGFRIKGIIRIAHTAQGKPVKANIIARATRMAKRLAVSP